MRFLIAALLGLSLATGASHTRCLAQEVDTADIASWIEQLDADQFSERQAASAKLAEAGDAAIPALVKAAQGDSREVIVRSIDILKNHFESGDKAIKEAAEKGLKELSESDNVIASSRAADAIKPKQQPAVGQGNLGGIIVGRGNIQIRVQAIGGNRRIQMKNANGVKEIEAEENGQKVKIKEDANGIKMQVTEKKDGKEVTKTYSAKNAAELKMKHPDAYKIYDRYANQQQKIQIRAAAVPQRVLPAIPVQRAQQIRRMRLVPPQQTKKAAEQIEAAEKQLKETQEKLKAQSEAAEGDLKKVLEESIEQIKAAQKELAEAKGQLTP